MTVDTMLLAFISGSVIPLATGLLTKLSAPSGLKAFFSALLAGVTAFVAYVTDFAGVGSWKEAVYVGLAAWVSHAGAYHGFWKPSGVAGAVQGSTATVGIG